jgi:dsDNA-specific endonuclease/ATPase MutS2
VTTQVADEKAVRDLEFDRLKGLGPVTDRVAIGAAFAEVEEAVAFLGGSGRFSLGGVRDLAPLLDRARQGGLSGEEFLLILQTFDSTLATRALLAEQEGAPLLRSHAERLTAGGDALGRRIRQAIDERGETHPRTSRTSSASAERSRRESRRSFALSWNATRTS